MLFYALFFQTNNSVINDWLHAVCNGLYTAMPETKSLFKFLFPNCESTSQQKIVAAPLDTSQNGKLSDGVIHSLSYGFHKSQAEQREGRPRNRAVQHRMLLPKRKEVRSRSRSPVNEANESDQASLADDVMDQQNPRYDPDLDDLFNDPDAYILQPGKLHLYFESYRPDLLLYKAEEVPDQDFSGYRRDEVQVKIVFELSSFKKFGKTSLPYHVQTNTEQCVQSCLSAFTYNQTLMYGIVIVVDGLKLVKFEKRINADGTVEYDISETDLVTWERTDAMHALFQMIADIL